jgi:DNA-binding transcriptional LysR family regulator
MNFTLHQLQVFLKITQTKSITKAATELFLTQPAVSIQLKNFQNQFEIPLTEVIGRQLFVTDFGKEIATAAQNILNEVYAINYKTLAYKGLLSGKLTISVVSTGKYVMPFFLSDFLKKYSGIDLDMDVTNKTKVMQSLENNDVDFAFISVLPDNFNLNSEPILENKLFLIGNKEAVLPPYENISELFQNIPMIFREKGSATRLLVEEFFESNSISVDIKLQLSTNEAVKHAVIAGLGFSIMPLIGLKNELENGEIKIIPLENFPITTTWRLVWLKNKQLSPVATAFLDYVENEKSQIIERYFSWIKAYISS